jgi:HD domain/GAF domain
METKTNSKIDLLEKEIDSLSKEMLNTYQEINLLYRISTKLGTFTDLHDIAETSLEEILEQIPAGRASVMLLNAGGKKLHVLASRGIPADCGKNPSVKVEDSVVRAVIEKGKPLLINDLREYPDLYALIKGNRYDTFSMVSVPLLVATGDITEEIIGTINLADSQGEKPYFTSRDQKILSAIAGQTAIAVKRIYLFNDLKRSQKETEDAFYYTVNALARGSEACDEDTGNHILRVGQYAKTLAEALGMGEEFCRKLFHFSQLHDVGKMHIHPDILRKPGSLTQEEWEVMKSHCRIGANIIGQSPQLCIALEVALAHHERWDGTGYPKGLKGSEQSCRYL